MQCSYSKPGMLHRIGQRAWKEQEVPTGQVVAAQGLYAGSSTQAGLPFCGGKVRRGGNGHAALSEAPTICWLAGWLAARAAFTFGWSIF